MSDIAGIVAALSSAAGTVSNIQNANAQANLRDVVQNRQLQQETNLLAASSPQAIAAGTGALTQPLSQQLVDAISRQTMNGLESQGVQGAPGLFQSVLEQALAPYLLQQQQNAESTYMQALGLQRGAVGMLPQAPAYPSSIANPYSAIGSFLQSKAFKDLMGTGASGTGIDSAYYQTVTDTTPIDLTTTPALVDASIS